MTSIFKILSSTKLLASLCLFKSCPQPTTSRAIPLFSSFYLFSVRRLVAFKVSVPSTPFFCRLFTWPSALMLAFRRCYTELVSSEIPTSTWLLMTKVSFRFFVRMPPKSKILEPRGYRTPYLPGFSGRSSVSISGACIRQITYKLRLSNRFSLVRSYFAKFTLRSSNFKSGGTSAYRLHKPLTIFINGLLSLLTLWVEQSRIAFKHNVDSNHLIRFGFKPNLIP